MRHDNERYWNKYNDLPTGINYTEYICPHHGNLIFTALDQEEL